MKILKLSITNAQAAKIVRQFGFSNGKRANKTKRLTKASKSA